MPQRVNYSAWLPDKEAVCEAAASVGCTQKRGKRAGKGNIQEMLYNIGGGEILVMFHNFDWPEDMRKAASQLYKISEDTSFTPDVSEIIHALGSSLKAAAALKSKADDAAVDA